MPTFPSAFVGVSTALILTAAGVLTAAEPGSSPDTGLAELPPLWAPALVDGPTQLVQPAAQPPAAALPNLSINSVVVANGSAAPMAATAGKRFWIRVDFSYDNPVCDPYAIRRTVNGFSHTAPAIDWGCGYSGTTSWRHLWGTWVMHHGGAYSVTVQLDANNAIEESNETDNSLTITIDVAGDVTAEWALVNAESGLATLGDGTDVIVGTMDDSFDYLHPWYTGNDSLGRPRLVAASQNALGTDGSPVNAGHATAVMGIVLARGTNPGDITGLAPDARYVTAEFINRASVAGLNVQHIFNAAGFLADNGAEVINMSWSWWSGTDEASQRGETSLSSLMADYLAYGRNIVCVPAVNQLSGFTRPTSPGSSRNVITVGGLDDSLQRAWSQQDHGPTLDGRGKPDLLGNDSANAVSPSSNWRLGFPAVEGVQGTSFAAPFVTGAVAQMLDFAKHTPGGRNRDHRVIKAILMNSGVKALDADGAVWSNSETAPLDDEQGTGILNLDRVHAIYAADEHDPGVVPVPGFDFHSVTGEASPAPAGGRRVYYLGSPTSADADLDVTLVWDRHTFWNDANGNNLIDSVDSFFVSALDAQDNLDLVLYRNGTEIAASRSTVDNIEHIHLTGLAPDLYELHVERLAVENSGAEEDYALAWHSDSVWINVPPTLRVTSIAVNGGVSVRIQFTVESGQADRFLLESTDDLAEDATWLAHPGVAAVPLGMNQFRFNLLSSGFDHRFFRIVALPSVP